MPVKNLKRITTYVEPDIYDALTKLADSEARTVSNLVARLLTKVIEQESGVSQNQNQNNIDK